jgi:hypothetical protein
LVETISNAGFFGTGYSDNNHLSVVPTLVAGALLTVLLIGRRCYESIRRPAEHRDWLIDIATRVAERSPLEDIPCVVLLQFIALFAMESGEQLLSGGRILGGTAWLGGPVWFSLVTHLLLGSALTIVLALSMRSIVKKCTTLITAALEVLLDPRCPDCAATFAHQRDEAIAFHRQRVHVHQLGERAPPLLPALT